MTTLIKTVLCAFLLLGLLVAGKVMLEHRLAPTTSGIEGDLHQPSVDIVLLGSSHTRQGYDVAALERATDRKAFAVAYDGLDLVSMVPLLKTLLADASRRPKLLVIEGYGFSLERRPGLEEPRLFFDAPPRMKWEFLKTYLHTHHGVAAYLDIWTLAANRGSDQILTYPFTHRAIDRLSYNGGYAGKEVPGFPPGQFAGLRIPVLRSEANADQVDAFRAIATMAAAYRVPLLLANPPMPGPAEAQPQIVSLQRQFRALAAEENVPFYEGAENFPIGDALLFHDSNHLSTAGRALYTENFARALIEARM